MTETPKYAVIKKQNEIEIRHYPAYIQAEVTIEDKQYRSAIEKGFNVLAGYIFGKIQSRKTSSVSSNGWSLSRLTGSKPRSSSI